MYRIENTEPNMTIMRMRAMYPSVFYDQNWYETEEFAHAALPTYSYDLHRDPTANELVWLLLHDDDVADYYDHYIWTLDYDHNSNQVYVGDSDEGIQIHRHLTVTDKWIHLYKYSK